MVLEALAHVQVEQVRRVVGARVHARHGLADGRQVLGVQHGLGERAAHRVEPARPRVGRHGQRRRRPAATRDGDTNSDETNSVQHKTATEGNGKRETAGEGNCTISIDKRCREGRSAHSTSQSEAFARNS